MKLEPIIQSEVSQKEKDKYSYSNAYVVDRAAHHPNHYCLSISREVIAQLGVTLCDPMDYRPPGSPVHGVSQARILEYSCRIQAYHVYTLRKPKLKETHVSQCSLQHYLQ